MPPPTQRTLGALTTRRLGDDRTECGNALAMTDVDRIYLGKTDRRYGCDGCEAWVPMRREAEASA